MAISIEIATPMSACKLQLPEWRSTRDGLLLEKEMDIEFSLDLTRLEGLDEVLRG